MSAFLSRAALFCYLLMLCALSKPATAQPLRQDIRYLSQDSVPNVIVEPIWRFRAGDLANGADSSLDDSSWPLTDSRLLVRNDTVAYGFTGIGWFRIHLYIDSSLARQPLAIRVSQPGASEIYLDGVLIGRYGRLLPADSAVYIDPQRLPLALPTLSPGHHVLALRYANHIYRENARQYSRPDAGPSVTIATAAGAIESYRNRQSVVLISCMLLFGIFITLSMVHLILYLYDREDRANGRFSFFTACVAVVLLVPCVITISQDAVLNRKLVNFLLHMTAVVAFSLSYLLNGLFARRKWHFYVVAAACLLMILFVLFGRAYASMIAVAVFVLTPLEALYILVDALRRRLPGARIIGGGLMLLIGLFLVIIALVIFQGDIYIDDDDLSGRIFIIVLVLGILSIPISMSMYLAWRFATVNTKLKSQLLQVETLNARAREQEAERQRLLESRQEELEREVAARTEQVRQQHQALVVAKQKSDDLLLNILPAEVAEELKETGKSEARLYQEVSVLFTDFVDFTQMSEHLSPGELVAEIDHCFKYFDDIITRHGLEKIKTVGDAYIAVSGMPASDPRHAANAVLAGLEIRAFMAERLKDHPESFGIRLGIHSGPVVAGIVGVKKFAYDIWGDTVNTAARMEQHSEPGELNITETTFALLGDEFNTSYRGELEVKHKGRMKMYFVR